MAGGDVEVVRAAFSAWDALESRLAAEPAGELIAEVFDAHLHPEVEYREDPEWPGSASYQGREAVKDCFRAYDAVMRFVGASLEQVVPAGDQVVVVARVAVAPQDAEVPVEHRWGYVCRVRDGKVSFMQAFVEPREAFRAAGVEVPADAA